MHTMWLLLQLISVILSFILMVTVLRIHSAKGHKYLSMTIVCTFIYCFGYLMELLADNIEAAMYATIFEYIGQSWICLLYAMFAYEYCDRKKPRKWFIFCACMDLFVLLCVIGHKYTNLYYINSYMNEYQGQLYLIKEKGILYYIHFLENSINAVLSIRVISDAYKKCNEKEKKNLNLLRMAAIIPFTMYIIFETGIFGNYDIIGIVFISTFIIIFKAVSHNKIFNVLEIAYENVVSTMKDAHVIVDSNYCFLDANPIFYNMFPDIDTMKKGVLVSNFFIRILDNPERITYMDTKWGFYKCHVSDIVQNDETVGHIITFIDLTDSQHNLERMRSLKKKADAANQAKSAFLAHMSHEIRTPMNAIIGYSELIIKERPTKSVDKYAKDIRRASTNLLAIINDILDISKIESGKMELVNDNFYVQELIKSILSITSISAKKKGLKYDIDISPDIPYVLYGDVVRIRQIIINLLGNAIKFTDQGSVSLSIDTEYVSDYKVKMIIKVKDTGRGIKEENKEMIFGQFSQMDVHKNKGIEGTGLGLSITKSLIEMMEGDISLESTYGVGSEFTVNIMLKVVDKKPVSEVDIEKILEDNENNQMKFIAPKANVLVVDDNTINLEVAEEYLKYYSIKADLVDSGEKAISMVQSKDYDIVLMDQMMPVMDGIETTKRIRELGGKYKDLVIIALTANAISGIRDYLIKNGFSGYQMKPISMDKLEKILLEYIPENYIEFIYENASETQYKEIKIAGLDIEKALENCGRNYEQYIKTLKSVVKHGYLRLEQMRDYLNNKDYQRYIIEAHALKSNAALIGAMAVSKMAANQEMAGKQENYDEIDKYGMCLCDNYEIMLDSINMWMKENCEENEMESLKATFEESMESLKEIRECLINKDYSKAFEFLDVLKMFINDKAAEDAIEDIDSSLKLYDYNAALEKLDVLMGGNAND